jgi:hypothetical protein
MQLRACSVSHHSAADRSSPPACSGGASVWQAVGSARKRASPASDTACCDGCIRFRGCRQTSSCPHIRHRALPLVSHHCAAKPALASHGRVVQGYGSLTRFHAHRRRARMRLWNAARASGVHESGCPPGPRQGLAVMQQRFPLSCGVAPSPRRELRAARKSVSEINTSPRWRRRKQRLKAPQCRPHRVQTCWPCREPCSSTACEPHLIMSLLSLLQPFNVAPPQSSLLEDLKIDAATRAEAEPSGCQSII